MIGPEQGPRGPRPSARVGPFSATLINGVFGDPLLHIRIANQKRSIFVDLGQGVKISARTAHQVTDVFLSHAHIDHIAGFMSFLRSRIGEWPRCRLYGPRDIARNIAGLVSGVHWDRIGHRAPRFAITEYHDDRLRRFSVVAGCTNPEPIEETRCANGELYCDDLMHVRSAVLDHFTPVLAFSFCSNAAIKVRKDQLDAADLRPGPWLTELKATIAAGETERQIRLPNGTKRQAASLAKQLLMVGAGEKLVYATDFADTHANRFALQKLAHNAHTLFCEAAFCRSDSEQARRTGHLTTVACAEIANAARVQTLIPFHFSRRYESDPHRVFAEVRSMCPVTWTPSSDGHKA